jgi:multidrug efflux pump subunit AcrB
VPGLSGEFFRHFGITIAAATAISCFCSLTLSPALAYLILRQPTSVEEAQRGRIGWLRCFFVRAGNRFDASFRRLSDFYGRIVSKLIHITPMMLGIYGLLIAATIHMLITTQKGLFPQDRGYLIVVVQLPGALRSNGPSRLSTWSKIALSTRRKGGAGFIGLPR